MGELSKKIGEIGERLVLNFLSEIGWGNPDDGLTVKCLHPKRHAPRSGNDRTTHGIDLLYRHKSSLEANLAENIIVSVKYSAEPYPRTLNTKFKSFAVDLIQTIDCFSKSEAAGSIRSIYGRRVKKISNVGVLMWLHNSPNGSQSVIDEISRAQFSDDQKYDRFYVVDNRRATFIYSSIRRVKTLKKDRGCYFHYNSTVQNFPDQDITLFGHVMPVEYLCSPLIPFRIINPDGSTHSICISYDGEFSKAAAGMVLSYARDLCSDFTQNIDIIFNVFNEVSDRSDANEAIQALNEVNSQFKVSIYGLDDGFWSLIDG